MAAPLVAAAGCVRWPHDRGRDIDQASVDWDEANLNPPFSFFSNGIAPPLSLPANSLDLIWAMSVFTHIADLWSDWLVETHRLLRQGGISGGGGAKTCDGGCRW